MNCPLTTPAAAARTISPAELAALGGRGSPVEMIDVRTPAEFAAVHAVGARLVPLDRLDPAVLPADRPIYLLCKSGGRAAKAAARCCAAGLQNVYIVAGGTDAWLAAGLPVIRGRVRVISLERQVRIAAGSLAFLGAVLTLLLHPAFALVSGAVGAGLVFAGLTDTCGMAMLLARMPWNQSTGQTNQTTCSA